MTKKVRLLVGTKKGAFILDSDEARRDWSVTGPLCEGWPVHDLIVEPGSGAILAAAGNPWYGPAIWRSEDGGTTWTHSSAGLTYGDGADPITTVWSLATTPDGGILAGVEPAGLFRSDDGGATWRHIEGLTNHPTRPTWGPGAGGLILHTIIPHPTDTDRTWVGISAVGVFETRDGGDVVGAAQRRRPRRVQPGGPVPGDRPVRPQVRDGRRRARDALPAQPLRRLHLRRRLRDLAGDHRRPADRLRVLDGDPPARPRHGWVIPLSQPDAGPLHARRRTRRSGGRTIAGRAGSARMPVCRPTTRTCRSCARRWPATRSTRSGSPSGRHRPALAQLGRRRSPGG